ncbi:DUF5805 domain-containing protein [Salinirarus marinus]|uniref:DUF5805 domain-containing protein n=1 Tax=Salinirarus marinus TaxID=3068310 RepID=UPI003C6CB4A7
MEPDDDVDTSRTAVKTYVPAYQKERWRDDAERLDMSQSEFVRTMVQAGRREFDVPETADASSEQSDDGDVFERRVRAALSESDHRSWDELVDRLTGGIEDRLESTLQELQAVNDVQYSGRHDGYTLVTDE